MSARVRLPVTTMVRIKFNGWKPMGLLEAIVSNKAIPKKKRRSELEAESADETIDEVAESTPVFVLSATNRLSSLELAKEYQEISCKRHETCFPLKAFRGDFGATNAVRSLLNELKELETKYPIHEEFDEDFASEQQLRNRTARILQGRRSQEVSIRHKEKEESEQLAIKLLQLANKKRAPPSTEELEWQQIVDRPVLFEGAITRRSKTVTGKDTCPCTNSVTRSGSEKMDRMPPCRLCSIPAEAARSEPVPFKSMMPLIRKIDTDAPEFLHHDSDDCPPDDNSEEKPAAMRGSKRSKYDPKKRKETVGKLNEVMVSMGFIEQYNAGLLQEVTK